MRWTLIVVSLALGCQQMPAQCPDNSAEAEMVEGLRPPPPDPSLVILPDGSVGHAWECLWPIGCIKRAGLACPRGYSVLGFEYSKVPGTRPNSGASVRLEQVQQPEELMASGIRQVVIRCEASKSPHAAPTDDAQEPLPELPPAVAAPAPAASPTPRRAP